MTFINMVFLFVALFILLRCIYNINYNINKKEKLNPEVLMYRILKRMNIDFFEDIFICPEEASVEGPTYQVGRCFKNDSNFNWQKTVNRVTQKDFKDYDSLKRRMSEIVENLKLFNEEGEIILCFQEC